MTRTQLASVCFVPARNCMRQQVLDDAKSLPNCGWSQSATTCESPYTPNSAQYFSVLCTTKYYSLLQGTTPGLLCTTKFHSSTTLYYKVLLQYYSVLQKHYSSTTLYCKVLLQFYSVLQVLLCATKALIPVLFTPAPPYTTKCYSMLQSTTAY